MRRYTFRVDAFVLMHAPLGGGEFVTKPIRFKGEKLVLNYATPAAGSARVELEDIDGTPVDGYSLNDCPEIYGDMIDQTIRWKSGPDEISLVGKTVPYGPERCQKKGRRTATRENVGRLRRVSWSTRPRRLTQRNVCVGCADADILEFRFPGALEPDRTRYIPRDASYQVVSLAVGGGR